MTIEFDPRSGDPDALLRALTAPYRGLSAKLDAEMDRDLAAASALGRKMRKTLDDLFPAVPAGKPAE